MILGITEQENLGHRRAPHSAPRCALSCATQLWLCICTVQHFKLFLGSFSVSVIIALHLKQHRLHVEWHHSISDTREKNCNWWTLPREASREKAQSLAARSRITEASLAFLSLNAPCSAEQTALQESDWYTGGTLVGWSPQTLILHHTKIVCPWSFWACYAYSLCFWRSLVSKVSLT